MRSEFENLLKNLQSYQFERRKQSKKKDIFDIDERNGQSFNKGSRENTNKSKRVGTNDWCSCLN